MPLLVPQAPFSFPPNLASHVDSHTNTHKPIHFLSHTHIPFPPPSAQHRTAFRHQFPLTLAHLLPLSLFATYVAYYLLVLRKSASLYPILRNTVLAPFGQYFISS